MFGRLTNVRIKAAEDALDQGRLAEAFDILAAPELADNGRVQALRGRLIDTYIRQGQDHMFDRNFADARSVFDKALRLDSGDDRARDWLRRADDAIANDRAAGARRQAALNEARRRMEAGSLNGAAEALGDTPAHDADRAALAGEIERREQKAAVLTEAARKALKEGRIAAAVADVTRARELHARQEGLADIESRLVADVTRQAGEHFRGGRLDLAASQMRLLGTLGKDAQERREMDDALTLAERVATELTKPDYAEADVLLGRLARLMPKAGWVAEARKRLRTIEDNRRALLEGPLGIAASLAGERAGPVTEDTMMATPRVPPPPRRHEQQMQPPADGADGMLPRRLLLRIDGAGSFLLVRGDRVSIGRAGPGASADVQLVSDLSDRHAEIVRAGEDYFVVSHSGVELAGQSTDHALLQNGDRIRLSRRARLTFNKPSLKSAAATLDLGEGVRMSSDCKRVLLCSGPILMGATRECHVRLAATIGDFVLTERGGRLFVKSMARGATGETIVLGDQVTIGELSFRVMDWEAATGTRATA